MAGKPPIGIRIARELAAELDSPPTEIPPIHDAVDLDAVERLVAHGASDDLLVSFDYQHLAVRVYGDERVEVSREGQPGLGRVESGRDVT
jgi:hypothetical protein